MPPLTEPETHVEMTPIGQAVTPTQTDQDTHVSRLAARKSWQPAIDILQKWWNDPEYFDDEDFDPPSRDVLAYAISLATDYDRQQTPPPAPDRVVPDGDSGIVFEINQGGQSEEIHFWDDGSVEYLRLSGSKLQERRFIGRT